MLLIETAMETLDWIEEPPISDNALNGNALNLGNISPLLFSNCFSSAASPALREPLFSVPKSKLLFLSDFSYHTEMIVFVHMNTSEYSLI